MTDQKPDALLEVIPMGEICRMAGHTIELRTGEVTNVRIQQLIARSLDYILKACLVLRSGKHRNLRTAKNTTPLLRLF